MSQLTKEETVHLLTVELHDADIDLFCIETEIESSHNNLKVNIEDLNSLLDQRNQIIERKLQLEEELSRVV